MMKEKKLTIEEFISGAIKGMSILMLTCIVGLCLFGTNIDYVCKVFFSKSNTVYAILGVVAFALVMLFSYGMGHLLEKSKHASLCMLGISALFFGGLVLLTYHYYFVTGWDAQVVEMSADSIARGQWGELSYFYYTYCSNNIFITYVFSLMIKVAYLLGITNHYYVIVFVQCFLYALTGLLLYHAVAMWLDIKTAVTTWVMFVLVVGLSPWVTVPYSDSTGLIFPVLLFYLYMLIIRKKHVVSSFFLMSLFAYIGYSIKPQIVIVIIAIIIVTISRIKLQNIKKIQKADVQKYLVRVGAILVGLLVGFLIVSTGIKATRLIVDKDNTYGMLHYLMMGLNEEAGGIINVEDQNFSVAFDNAKERTEGQLRVIKERITTLGPEGLLRLFKKKTLTNFSDGTFAWWQEGKMWGFVMEERSSGNATLRSYLSEYFYQDGRYYKWFLHYSQILWMGTLLINLIAAVLPFKGKDKKELDVLRLSLIGITLFELLFEARARYIFIYVPMFVVAAGTISVWIQDMLKVRKKQDI